MEINKKSIDTYKKNHPIDQPAKRVSVIQQIFPFSEGLSRKGNDRIQIYRQYR